MTLIIAANQRNNNISEKAKCMQNATKIKNLCYKEAKKIYSTCERDWEQVQRNRVSFWNFLKECRQKSKINQTICKNDFKIAVDKCKNPNNYVCPDVETIDCMPIVQENMQMYCNNEFRNWAKKNCDIVFLD